MLGLVAFAHFLHTDSTYDGLEGLELLRANCPRNGWFPQWSATVRSKCANVNIVVLQTRSLFDAGMTSADDACRVPDRFPQREDARNRDATIGLSKHGYESHSQK